MTQKRKVLAEQFGKQQRWVIWRYETLKGKKTKIPYHVSVKKASSTDKKTWVDYATAATVANENDRYDGVGLVFTASRTLLGIDIDHCVKNSVLSHPLAKQIRQFIDACDTYTELSPSEEGLHLFLQVDEALDLEANKRAPYELYTKGRYFTVTNVPFGTVKNVRSVTKAEVEKLLSIIEYPWTKVVNSEEAPVELTTLSESLTDEQVLKKMFASKNGEDIKNLYDGNISEYKDDASKADMALCSHFAFWCRRDKAQMERLWLLSTLGSREKTKKRLDYRSRTLDAAIAHCKEVYTPPLHSSKTLDLLFRLDSQGKKEYVQNTENICRVLRKHPDFAGRMRYDAFKNIFEYRPADAAWRDMQDIDAIDIQTHISVLFSIFGKVGKDMVYDAMIKVCKENEFDSAIEYVKSVQWDKTARLDQWLQFTYGTPDDVYHRSVGSNWFKGMVKRIIEPGCKFDYVLVLEVKQGSKKSMSLSVLGGEWHVETTMSTDNKDFFMQFQGNIIVEFSEGETLNRTEVKRMKAIITTQFDKYRPPYGRATVSFSRRCVFAMTTNQEEYLKDETGNRRWLPVTVRLPQADVAWLKENRDQLFAEAYYRLTEKKETVYEFPEKEVEAEQHARRVEDPNLEAIMDWYWALPQIKRQIGITVYQVIREVLHAGFLTRPITKTEQMSVASVLRDFMMLTRRQTMDDGKREVRWYNSKDGVEVDSVPANMTF